MNTTTIIENYFKSINSSIIEQARLLGYSLENQLILLGNEDAIKEDYPEIYNRLKSYTSFADRRSPFEYLRQLISSWVIEDYIKCLITDESQGIKVELNGADKERKILYKNKISTEPDYLITTNKYQVKTELVCDYTGFWKKNSFVTLRNRKYDNLVKQEALLLCIDFSRDDNIYFSIIDFAKEVKSQYIDCIPQFGGKPGNNISFTDNFYILSPNNVRIVVNNNIHRRK